MGVKHKVKKIIFGIMIILLVIISGSAAPAKAARVFTMEGYVSRYNPGHISSAEAWAIARSDGAAVILDLRSALSYDERHVTGAVNVPFETLANYTAKNLPDKGRPVIFYCFCGDKGGSALSAYNHLIDLGYTNVFYTEPGSEWTYEGTSVNLSGTEETDHKIVTGDEAKALYDTNPGAILLDVRNMDEYETGHINGSILIPAAELESRLSELPDKNAVIIIYCKGGTRSKIAYEILLSAGYFNIYDMQKADNWPLPLVK